jgi:hypothetical protein
MSISLLRSFTSRLSLGTPQQFRNLVVVPLLDPAASPAGWLTLGQALGRGLAEVSEISEQGSVPHLKLLNRAREPLFLLDGEELVGAKQNRILNLSVLAPAEAALDIPVSCVEQGRWSWRTRHFEDSERVIFSKLRARNSASVTNSWESTGEVSGDQLGVWQGVALKLARLSVDSHTSAASDIYEKYAAELDGFVAATRAQSDQVGAAFLVDGRLAGFDLFGGPDLLRDLLPRLVRSYALDAIEQPDLLDLGLPKKASTAPGSTDASAIMAVQAALDKVPDLEINEVPPVGMGGGLRLKGRGLAGSSLVAAERLAHLSLWASDWR